MFFSADADGMHPLELSGVGARQEVKNLQASLARLAHFTRRPMADPGPANGVIGEKTMISIGGVMDILQQRLPPWVIDHLHKTMMLGASSTEAKNTVGRYVTELRVAADQASDYFAHIPNPGDFQQPPMFHASLGFTSFFTPGWFRDPARLAIIGGIVLIGIWIYARTR